MYDKNPAYKAGFLSRGKSRYGKRFAGTEE